MTVQVLAGSVVADSGARVDVTRRNLDVSEVGRDQQQPGRLIVSSRP